MKSLTFTRLNKNSYDTREARKRPEDNKAVPRPGCASATWVENGTGFLVPPLCVATRKAPQGKGAPSVRPAARLGAVAQRADLVATVGNEVQRHNPLLCRDLLGLGRLVATLPRISRLATRARQTRTDSARATRLPSPLPRPPRARMGRAPSFPRYAWEGGTCPRNRRTPSRPLRCFVIVSGIAQTPRAHSGLVPVRPGHGFHP
jgi:hypothetical protein